MRISKPQGPILPLRTEPPSTPRLRPHRDDDDHRAMRFGRSVMKTPFLCWTSAVTLFLSVGCEADPLLGTAAPGAALDFMNGPLDLPNVFRGDSVLSFAWADMTQDMVIVINMPPGGVRALRRCGGTSTRDPQPVQTVGDLQDVSRQLRLWQEVNIHVYQPVPAAFLQPPAG